MFKQLLERFGRTPTKDEFAQRMLRTIASQGGPELKQDPGSESFSSETGARHNLRNMYLRYSQASSGERPSLLQNFANGVIESLQPPPMLWAVGKSGVVPLFRNALHLESSHVPIGKKLKMGPRKSFGVDLQPLVITYGVDSQSSIQHLTEELFSTWGQTIEEVDRHAIANLSRLCGWRWVATSAGTARLEASDYAESLVVLPSFSQTLPFGEHTVIGIPARGVVLAADARQPSVVASLCTAMETRVLESPWPISVALMIWRDGAWRRYEAGDAIDRPGVRRLKMLGDRDDYSTQKETLERLFEEDSIDVFVATHQLVEVSNGDSRFLRSYCVWSNGVDSLLPEAEVVVLLSEPEDKSQAPLIVPWTIVMRLARSYFEPTPEYPVRYRVRDFPDAATFEALAGHAVEMGAPELPIEA